MFLVYHKIKTYYVLIITNKIMAVLKNSPKSLSREKKSTNHQRVPSNFSTQPKIITKRNV